MRFGRLLVVVLLTLAVSVTAVLPVAAVPIGNDAFQRTWNRTDKPVSELRVSRTWMWGPEANTGLLTEPFIESPGGQRTVQYFDKSRMEINEPNGDPNSIWYVTNGLLVVELVTGQMQVGNNTFQQHDPAQVNATGDWNDTNAPTYATFNPLGGYGAIPNGWVITQTLDRAGNVGVDERLASHNVKALDVGAPTHHNVASVFWDFMNSSGLVYQNGPVRARQAVPESVLRDWLPNH